MLNTTDIDKYVPITIFMEFKTELRRWSADLQNNHSKI